MNLKKFCIDLYQGGNMNKFEKLIKMMMKFLKNIDRLKYYDNNNLF